MRNPAQRRGRFANRALRHPHQPHVVAQPLQVFRKLLVRVSRNVEFGQQGIKPAMERGQPLGKMRGLPRRRKPYQLLRPGLRRLGEVAVVAWRWHRVRLSAVGGFRHDVPVIGANHQ